MDELPGFLQCIQIKSIKRPSSNPHSIKTFEELMQFKHVLEESHKNIVKNAVNPFLNQKVLINDKTHTRNKEFKVKPVHRISCPAFPSKAQAPESFKAAYENEEMLYTEETLPDASFTTPQFSQVPKPAYTSISYAEYLFGSKKHEKTPADPSPLTSKRFPIHLKSKFNNKYTRIIAGSIPDQTSKVHSEPVDDPLKSFESKLPKRFRSSLINSPWTYSSELRTSTIFPVKPRSSRMNKDFS